VGLGGIEPPTSPLSGVRSSHLSYRPKGAGGAGRDRTGDLLNANQALSQLSYSPLLRGAGLPAGEINRGQLDAETGRPAPGRLEELSNLSGDLKRTHDQRRSADRGCGVERLFLTRPRCTLKRFWLSETPPTFSLRKEVIQPQVLLRLPCYDFTPIMDHTLGRCPPCGSACRLLVQSTFVM
jgi:hypothetical protein